MLKMSLLQNCLGLLGSGCGSQVVLNLLKSCLFSDTLMIPVKQTAPKPQATCTKRFGIYMTLQFSFIVSVFYTRLLHKILRQLLHAFRLKR